MKKSYIVLLSLFYVLISVISSGCSRTDTNTINLSSLLISVDEFPTDWFFNGFGERGIDEDRSIDSVSVFFNSSPYPDTHGSTQDVYRFKTIWDAQRDFETELKFYEKYYSVPLTWKYVSSLANESHFSCREEAERCFWVARYRNLVIEFQGPVTPNLLSLEDFENIVKAIDLKAGRIILGIEK